MKRLPGTLLATGRKTRREVPADEKDLNFYPVMIRKVEREVSRTKGKQVLEKAKASGLVCFTNLKPDCLSYSRQ